MLESPHPHPRPKPSAGAAAVAHTPAQRNRLEDGEGAPWRQHRPAAGPTPSLSLLRSEILVEDAGGGADLTPPDHDRPLAPSSHGFGAVLPFLLGATWRRARAHSSTPAFTTWLYHTQPSRGVDLRSVTGGRRQRGAGAVVNGRSGSAAQQHPRSSCRLPTATATLEKKQLEMGTPVRRLAGRGFPTAALMTVWRARRGALGTSKDLCAVSMTKRMIFFSQRMVICLFQGVLGIKVKIMLDWDPKGKLGLIIPLPDLVSGDHPRPQGELYHPVLPGS